MENEKEVEEVKEEDDSTSESDNESTDWKAEAIKARGMYKRMETKYMKATEKKIEPPAPKEEEKEEVKEVKKGELDNADYALLSVKGYEDEEDIEFIHKQMLKWDKSLRETLQDDEIKAKLLSMRQERETKAAIPNSTKRSGKDMSTLELDIARYERTGTLPQNFERRSAVINAKVEKENTNKPAWHR